MSSIADALLKPPSEDELITLRYTTVEIKQELDRRLELLAELENDENTRTIRNAMPNVIAHNIKYPDTQITTENIEGLLRRKPRWGASEAEIEALNSAKVSLYEDARRMHFGIAAIKLHMYSPLDGTRAYDDAVRVAKCINDTKSVISRLVSIYDKALERNHPHNGQPAQSSPSFPPARISEKQLPQSPLAEGTISQSTTVGAEAVVSVGGVLPGRTDTITANAEVSHTMVTRHGIDTSASANNKKPRGFLGRVLARVTSVTGVSLHYVDDLEVKRKTRRGITLQFHR